MIGETKNASIPFNTTLSFRCKESISGYPDIDYEPKATANNSFVIVLYHSNACGKTIRGPFGFIGDLKWLVIPFSFIFGCYLMIFGIKSIKVLLALLGGVTGFIVGSSVISLFWKNGGNLETSVQFGTGLVMAGIFGAVAYFNKVIGRLLGGLVAGFILLLQVYYLVGYEVESKGQNVVVVKPVFFVDRNILGRSFIWNYFTHHQRVTFLDQIYLPDCCSYPRVLFNNQVLWSSIEHLRE